MTVTWPPAGVVLHGVIEQVHHQPAEQIVVGIERYIILYCGDNPDGASRGHHRDRAHTLFDTSSTYNKRRINA